jgi:hypothetical protein
MANALPQALILTAIVIGFAMSLFLLILLYRTYARSRTLHTGQAVFLSEAAGDNAGSDGSNPEPSGPETSEKEPP